jgi:hypothetical protein
MTGQSEPISPFEQVYPNVSEWVKGHGWIEIGYDEYSRAFVRAFDIGGTVWEGEEEYPSLDHALRALEASLTNWMEQNGFE